jgi:chemotaxis protein methyltransferase CheR
MKPLTALDFETVRELAKTACGISLHEGKKALVSSRIEKLVRGHGFGSFTEYIRFVSLRKHGPEFTEFIDTLTTNHSSFWREPEHFIYLQNTVFQQHRGRTRIWCAAAATGEEPYTLAMCALSAGVPNCTIVASDISTAALKTAIRGEYDAMRLAALPMGWKNRYLTPTRHGIQETSVVSAQVRDMIRFMPLNLLQPFGHLGQFDIIFCRNVMIYFEQSTRDHLVERLVAQIAPGGFLFTGHSETLLKIPAGLEYLQPAAYRKL